MIIDTTTQKRIFVHYACVLVDFDFSRHIFDEIMVEREDFSFKLEVVYEWLQDYCSHVR